MRSTKVRCYWQTLSFCVVENTAVSTGAPQLCAQGECCLEENGKSTEATRRWFLKDDCLRSGPVDWSRWRQLQLWLKAQWAVSGRHFLGSGGEVGCCWRWIPRRAKYWFRARVKGPLILRAGWERGPFCISVDRAQGAGNQSSCSWWY